MKMKKPELLVPAGSPEALDAAINAGADAIYFGGTLFNARMNAANFDDAAVCRAAEKCRANNVRSYITFNTLILDRELDAALKYAEFLYSAGVDALILADRGLAALIHDEMPDFELHASTQMSGHNTDAAKYLAGAGFSRMVCAREMSFESISKLVADSPIEIEMFVHGAHCVSHSGQCLMSSVIGGRSGNRGECAQPCRLGYNGSFPLSLKDMCLAGHITEITSSGVASLKIEGRMKSPSYVYGVASIYRKLLDEDRNAEPRDIKKLAELFSRGGFTDGYFTHKISDSMLGVRSENDKSATKKAGGYTAPSSKVKTGTEVDIKRTPPPHKAPEFKKAGGATPKKSARFYSPEQISGSGYFDEIYLPLSKFEKGAANGVLLPPVIYDRDAASVLEKLLAAKAKGAEHILCTNAGHIELAKESGLCLHGDFRLNVFNSPSFAAYPEFCDIILSPELTLPQIRDIPGEKSVIVYGRLPLMLLEKRVGAKLLRDRRGAAFPIIREEGRDILINSVPIYMADRQDQLKKSGALNMHFIFTTENKSTVDSVIAAFKKGTPPKTAVKRIK